MNDFPALRDANQMSVVQRGSRLSADHALLITNSYCYQTAYELSAHLDIELPYQLPAQVIFELVYQLSTHLTIELVY